VHQTTLGKCAVVKQRNNTTSDIVDQQGGLTAFTHKKTGICRFFYGCSSSYTLTDWRKIFGFINPKNEALAPAKHQTLPAHTAEYAVAMPLQRQPMPEEG
jgi:hypothetical protein